jgi:hypothetical protein
VQTQKKRVQDRTSWRVLAWIGKPWALKNKFLLTATWVDPPNGKFFGAVTCPKPGLTEFSHPLDQCLQARSKFRLLSLIINLQWKEMLVCPLRFIMYINMEPLLGGAFPAALERGVQILIPTMVAQRKPNLGEDLFVIPRRRIKILEQTGIKGNPEPTFT